MIKKHKIMLTAILGGLAVWATATITLMKLMGEMLYTDPID